PQRPKSQNKILFFILRFCLSLSKKSVRTFLTSWTALRAVRADRVVRPYVRLSVMLCTEGGAV
ncbi:hypothetical protein, partial [Vescimonas sp.]|uniref:hypothetical protein n=1 Tax=Vescimonas sp. TaxID=2892404 RepID=UPI003F7E9BD9